MSRPEQLEQLLAVIDALPDPVFILTEGGRYAGIAGGKDSRFYHDGSVLLGASLHEVLPKAKADLFLRYIHKALEENNLQTVEYSLGGEEVEGLDTDNGPAGMLWFEGRVQPLPSLYEGERAVVWVARNITRRYEIESKLRNLSEHDELTGLFNRRKLLADLKIRFNEYHRYQINTALLMVDIDHFKLINDECGHLVGDDVLVHVARVCDGQLRESDQLARFGGEEFAAILPHATIEEARQVAERLRVSVEQNVKHPTTHQPLTISIGISQFHEDDGDEEALIRRADDAMYTAKHEGRNRIAIESPEGKG